MKIKQLRLNDFGIFDQQVLSDIHSNVVVIGGYNRAGKTTLMKALRYMGFGFPKDKKLAYKRNQFDVSFDVDIEGEDYRCVVEGHREPKIYGLSTRQPLNRTLYPIDPFTYRQLYTLDINQLKPSPDLLQNKEKEQLKSILLGAGLQELTSLPQLRKQFDYEAKKIGATKGNPSTKQFAPYTKEIEAQENALAEAIKDINRYDKLKKELTEIQEKIIDEKQIIKKRQDTMDYLSLLMNHYDLYCERQKILTQLDRAISEEEAKLYPEDKRLNVEQHWANYTKQQQALNEKIQQFAVQTGNKNITRFVYLLVKYRNNLTHYFNQLSGIRVRIEQLKEAIDTNQKNLKNAQESLHHVSEQWEGESLGVVKELPIDDANRIELSETINSWRKALAEKEKKEETVLQLTSQVAEMKRQLKIEQKQSNTTKQWIATSVMIGLGIVVGSMSKPFYGLLIGIVGGLTIVAQALIYNKTMENHRINRRQLQTRQTELALAQQQYQVQISKVDQIESKLDVFRDWLRVGGSASAAVIDATFSALQRIQGEYYRIGQQEETIKRLEVKCKEQLKEIEKGVQAIEPLNDEKAAVQLSLVEYAERVIGCVEKLYSYCQPALEISVLNGVVTKEKATLKSLTGPCDETYFQQYIQDWIKKGTAAAQRSALKKELDYVNYRIRRLFEHDANRLLWHRMHSMIQSQSKIEQFDDAYNQYLTLTEIEQAYHRHQKEQLLSQEFLTKNEETRGRLQQRIEDMSTDLKIMNIQEKIDQSRAELKPLAYRYAVLRTAEYIINKIEKQTLQTMKETLFKQASHIFERITKGEYGEIYPVNGLMGEEFAIVNQYDEHYDTAEKMSRGTLEQLYLAVRLSRIKEMKTSLPIIIDDSFVNFDYQHIRQTMMVINELSQTHQVFIMTCHRALVKQINDIVNEAQYYQLERGVFTESTGRELADYLVG